jgi:hypothetical protein
MILWRNAKARNSDGSFRHPWRWVLFIFIDELISTTKKRKPAERDGTLVVLMSRLGDAIMSRPLVLALHRLFGGSGHRFTVLGERNWAVLGPTLYADVETHFVDARRFRFDLCYRLSLISWVRRQNYSNAICFMHHRIEMREDSIVALSGADQRIVSELPFRDRSRFPRIFGYYLSKMTRVIPQPDVPVGIAAFAHPAQAPRGLRRALTPASA